MAEASVCVAGLRASYPLADHYKPAEAPWLVKPRRFCWQFGFTAAPRCIRAAMLLSALSVLLHVDLPKKSGAGTCYIVGQQYSDRFPELVMVELSNGRDSTCFQYRFEILRDLEEGWVYYTAELQDSRLKPLNKVEAVEVAGQKYLRIDGRNESRDDLGPIPEI